MAKKQIMKNIIKTKINKENIRNNILSEENSYMSNSILKYALCLIVVGVFGVIIFNNTKNDNSFDNNIKINKVDYMGASILDAEVKEINDIQKLESEYYFYKDLVNNRLFNGQKTYEVFTRESVESKEYNILNNYSVVAFNDVSSIEVSFSKNNKPLRDYFFEDNGKSYSSINGEKIKIYSYGKSYMATFNYKGINFDIESSNISENDFLELLSLIIK